MPAGTYDFIWASPPCTEYSIARTTAKTPRNFALADAIVARTLEIINHLKPKGWMMENPAILIQSYNESRNDVMTQSLAGGLLQHSAMPAGPGKVNVDRVSKDSRSCERIAVHHSLLLHVLRRNKPQIQKADSSLGSPSSIRRSTHVHAEGTVRVLARHRETSMLRPKVLSQQT